MAKKVLYVVDHDSTTSIPLEIAARIKAKYPDFETVVYFKNSSDPPNPFLREMIHINAEKTFDLAALKRAIDLVKRTMPDMIHAHHTLSALLFFILAKLYSSSTRLMITVHQNPKAMRWGQRILNFFNFLLADRILSASQSAFDSFSFLEKNMTQHKMEVVYSGVDQKLIKNANRQESRDELFKKRPGERVIGSVGQMNKARDYETLVKAFEHLYRGQDREVKLLLIGDGEEREQLEAIVKGKDLSRVVVFTGSVDRELVYSLLKLIDVFVITSRYEGFSNSLVEALAAERPVVCSDINTMKEMATDAALYAEPGNHSDFASQILHLLENDDLMTLMKLKAGRRAKYFSLEACVERYIEHY